MSNLQPAYQAYTVIKREGQDDFWLNIGAGFWHKSGGGINVILQALPIASGDGQCKIVLRPPKETDEPPSRRVNESHNRRSERRER